MAASSDSYSRIQRAVPSPPDLLRVTSGIKTTSIIEDGSNRNVFRIALVPHVPLNLAISNPIDEDAYQPLQNNNQEDDTTTSVDSFITITTNDSVANDDADVSSSMSSSNEMDPGEKVDKKGIALTCEATCDSENQSSTLSPCTPSRERMLDFDYQHIIAANNETVSDTPDESDVFEVCTSPKCLSPSEHQFHTRHTAEQRLSRRGSSSSDTDAGCRITFSPVKTCRRILVFDTKIPRGRKYNALHQRLLAQLSFSQVRLNAHEVAFLSVRRPLPPPRPSIIMGLDDVDFSGVPEFGSELSFYLETETPAPTLSKDPLIITLERDPLTIIQLCEQKCVESDTDMYVKHESASDDEAYGRRYSLLMTITIGDIMIICFPKVNAIVFINVRGDRLHPSSCKGRNRRTRTLKVQVISLYRGVTVEVQYGMASSLALSTGRSTIAVWKAISNSRCTIGLLHRDFSTSQLSSATSRRSASHSTPSASESSQAAGAVTRAANENESSAIKGSVRIRNFVSLAFDAKEVTALLHAADYSTIIQIVEPLLPISARDDSYIPAHFILGVAYFKLTRYKNAAENFEKCKNVALKTHNDGDVMLSCAYLGDMQYTLQTYKAATEYYEVAIKHYASGSVAVLYKLTPPSLSAIHAKCASSFRNMGMMVEAVDGYREAIDMAQIDRDRLSAHTSLGNLYQSMGDNSNALQEYEASIELATSLSDYVSLGWAHGNIGNAYLGLNRKDEALFNLKKSLDLAIEYERTPQAIGRTYNNLGTAYQSINDLDQAMEYYDLALSQAEYGNDKAGKARVRGNIGNVHMLRKNYEQAIPNYSEVLDLSSDEPTVSTARHNRGCAFYEWATSLHQGGNRSSAIVLAQCGNDESISSYNSTQSLSTERDGNNEQRVALLRSKVSLVRSSNGCRGDDSTQSSSESRNDFIVDHSIHGPDCNVNDCLSKVPKKAREHYQDGSVDLQEVIKYHEKRFGYIKGSPQGLTMSVCLFESNSRTFHRLQDCYVNLHEIGQALAVAEQSRARTLGELMLKRKESQLKRPLTSPLSLEDIKTIVQQQASSLAYFSYTGARLVGWVFVTESDNVSMNMFEVHLSDEQFDGKSLDYYLRYSLTEKLVERNFEMYQSIVYNRKSSEPVQNLFRLVARPTLEIVDKLNCDRIQAKSHELIVISDSYTALLPLSCLHDPDKACFFVDNYGVQNLPSFLTMGILNQLPEVTIGHEDDPHDFCVIGDPNIPSFVLNHEVWALGRLPYAKREAEWVARTLKTTPILGDNATKESILLRLSSAKIVHIATHGSASAGFLAFAPFSAAVRPGSRKHANHKMVLLYPEEVERLHISPALVVLSSCDSGRGTVKADGIQGMARAFILAGAQSVLTTLWKVPDESASVFMQFFYRYLTDGLQSSLALQKSILSVRCFAKYSQYIHWSGYQLTGRNICFLTSQSLSDSLISERLESPTAFPRISELKKLEKCLVESNCLPTDVQVMKGCAGVKSSEVVTDFIHANYKKFSAGVFWICSKNLAILSESIGLIEKILDTSVLQFQLSEAQQALFVFDNLTQLPQTEEFLRILKSKYVHIIVIYQQCPYPNELVKEIDRKLIRGCNVHEIDPLSMIHSTQRIVYSVMKHHNFIPYNDDQQALESLAKMSCGSPVIIDLISQVLLSRSSQSISRPDSTSDMLQYWSLLSDNNDCMLRSVSEAMSKIVQTLVEVPQDQDVWTTNSKYDSWDSIDRLIVACNLTVEEKLLLNCLSLFGCSPVPMFLITEISSLIASSVHKQHLTASLHVRLFDLNFVKRHPSPVVYCPSLKSCFSHNLAYVPEYISQCILKSLADIDTIVAFTITVTVINKLHKDVNAASVEAFLIFLMCALILDKSEANLQILGNRSYEETYSLYLSCKRKLSD